MTTPNPDLDKTANARLLERTAVLRGLGLKVQPVIVTGVNEVPLDADAKVRVARVLNMPKEDVKNMRQSLLVSLGRVYGRQSKKGS